MKILRTLRGHWKKSVFGAVVISFGGRWCVTKYRDAEYMRHVCLEARQFGDESLPVSLQPRHVTVVLNPAANRGKSVDMFERWCAPLLHLAGLKVAVVRSEQPGEISQLLTMMDNTDAVIVAGGNGTVVEAITGLMRRQSAVPLPVAIVPLGITNTLADRLWGHAGDPVRQVTTATMSAIRQNTTKLNVLEISPIQSDSEGSVGRSVFAVCRVHWGAVRDTLSRVQQYWYWGALRQHAAYLFTALRTEDICWNCSAELDYVPPCPGCSKCARQKLHAELNETPAKSSGSWWSRWLKSSSNSRSSTEKLAQDRLQRMMSVTNAECGQSHQLCLSTTDCRIDNVSPLVDHEQTPGLRVSVGPMSVSWYQFVANGWNSLRCTDTEYPSTKQVALADNLTLLPVSKEQNKQPLEHWISVDGEPFELKPMHVRLLPEAVTVFV